MRSFLLIWLCLSGTLCHGDVLPLLLKGFWVSGGEVVVSVFDEKQGRSFWLKEGARVPGWEDVTLASVHVEARFIEFSSDHHGHQRLSLDGARYRVDRIERTPEAMGLDTMVRVFQSKEARRQQGQKEKISR